MEEQHQDSSAFSRDGDTHDGTYFSPIVAHPNPTALPEIRRSSSGHSQRLRTLNTKESRDPELDINLPYRTLSPNANLNEYRSERPDGELPGPMEADGEHRYRLVTFVPDDPENPKNWSKARKWYITMVIATTCFVVAFCSSVITADIIGVTQEFGVSTEVVLLTVSVFVIGFGVGEYQPMARCALGNS